MGAAAILTNLLLASAALAVPSLEGSPEIRQVAHSPNTLAGAVHHDGAGGIFTAVSGVFTIPEPLGFGEISPRINIDAISCNVSFHTGVTVVTSNGVSKINAWYQWYPNDKGNFTMVISPNDVIRATLTTTSRNSGTAMIENLTTNHVVTASVQDPANTLCQQDAGWVVKIGDPVPFLHTISFTDATATIPAGNISPAGANILDVVREFGSVTPSVDSTGRITVPFSFSNGH